MYIDLSNANEAVGKIVYKTHNPKTLYLIESIKQVNPFDVTVVIKAVDGKTEATSSLGLKCFDTLVEETTTKLKNHEARLWNFKKKLGIG